ncbi:MAG: glutamate--cysteine ligase [Deltaproteobacteria bacterium TMED126]|jgi:glutamate--cysteine ligase|nr:glutamate--cysteine ligase [Deltaproteobacteria bacterium TMED126]|tara:strand:+ start:13736 stop:14896 length:1161 start_codon:yes stop_codon:yes gene_type:complete
MSILNYTDPIIAKNLNKIDEWIKKKKEISKPPFYTSTDIRVSENKVVAVDTNIFPAGFNNLSNDFLKKSAKNIKMYIEKLNLPVERILIIPELHTRNPFYWDNIIAIKKMFEIAGILSDVGLIVDDGTNFMIEFDSTSDLKVKATTVDKSSNKVFVNDFMPDLILINNDFSTHFPNILKDIDQPVIPPVEVGWHSRRKNIHFDFYNSLVDEFCKIFNMDSKIFQLKTELIKNINVEEEDDRSKVANLINELKSKIGSEQNIFIKSNSGTYGMSVMQVNEGSQFVNLNRSGKKKMKVSKGGKLLSDLIVQEGVDSIFGKKEPVYYLIDCKISGAFYRVNDNKSSRDNLNTRGMYFEPISESGLNPTISIISQIGSLATGLEIQHLTK